MKAKALIGTPWHHQGRLPGIGIDCVGVVAELAPPAMLTSDRYDYGRDPVDGSLEESLDRLFPSWHKPAQGDPPGALGDVLLFEHPGSGRQHLGVYIGDGEMIHAQAGRRVCQVPIDRAWRRLLKKVYRWEV